MCPLITQAKFSCGHQVLYWDGNARFCLFYPHVETDLHMATITYTDNKETCLECVLRNEANQKGLHGRERHEYIRGTIKVSQEKASRDKARLCIEKADKSQRGSMSPARVAELNAKAQAQVKYYLQKRGRFALGKSGKLNLLKSVLQVPPMIDRKALVTAFGTYCVWDVKDGVWKGLPSAERSILTAIARHAGMAKTLEAGFKAEKPVEVTKPGKVEEPKGVDSEKGEKPAEAKTVQVK
ncbi:hypothetical protein F5Y04DRAFT_288062 [Hypomontagnella monticulosa]|nr:hypothetical protein F5Y04DRAFT_288062 [Hypomontagnella monticulosa]